MAYNPNVPAPTNRVQDDIAAMRDNFQHLDPLAQAVGELQAVSELAPYVQAILDSRIVDHNLGVSAPPNGHYVRFDNGLQICFGRLPSSPASQHWNYLNNGVDTTGIERQWTPPAAFSAASATYQDVMLDLRWGFALPFRQKMSYAYVTPTPIDGARSIVVHFAESVPNLNFSVNFDVYIFAMGRWK